MSLKSYAPYHLLSYGTLLGSQVFESFVSSLTAFRVLPRPAFSTLQTALLPMYFRMQTVLPVVLAITYPGYSSPTGQTIDSGIYGFLAEGNRWTVLAPLTISFVCGLANVVYIGPTTTSVMKERKHQETRDGKRSFDPGPHSPEMQRLNKKFGILHGVSSLVNLFSIIAAVWYGFGLSARL